LAQVGHMGQWLGRDKNSFPTPSHLLNSIIKALFEPPHYVEMDTYP
jgi:hypothetical protein